MWPGRYVLVVKRMHNARLVNAQRLPDPRIGVHVGPDLVLPVFETLPVSGHIHHVGVAEIAETICRLCRKAWPIPEHAVQVRPPIVAVHREKVHDVAVGLLVRRRFMASGAAAITVNGHDDPDDIKLLRWGMAAMASATVAREWRADAGAGRTSID